MNQSKRIKTALISVFYKENLAPIIKQLHADGVTLLSTGGTRKFIEDLNIPCQAVEDLTSYPSILGGRVKTLHPKVFGGILTRRANESDQKEIAEFEIPEIDLVIVDLYPFEETVKSGASAEDIIEKIDIGGISLIRAAAKNFNDVLIVSSKNQYADLLKVIQEGKGSTSIENRRRFAAQAFQISSHYDTAIFNYFNKIEEIDALKISEDNANSLRYGENPHQKGTFFGNMDELFDKLHGKELSYNNLLDVDAAVNLIGEFTENDPTFAILKHNNACGIATRATVLEAYEAALAGDPVSAFGGVLITNQTIDDATAEAINPLFCEVVIAPSYSETALTTLQSKKNRIILVQKQIEMPTMQYRSILNGALVQDKDLVTDKKSNFKTVTRIAPTAQELDDLEFASKLVKQTKSNAIILAKNGQLLAGGTGQTSRVDALNQAIKKAKEFNFDLNGAVMASDAFFPFPDCVEIAKNAGITAVIQPGGSIKDELSIDYCNNNDLAMVFTGTRHFKH
ncbi:bifunctional phosphoribosylaminoimidazolecarboxamide formyltransferase/IMP cyclohydrolase [Vicingaceae bacterium]|nr:bifunctional phosphoribosylaminoimidazolecarboxamide formyltransferase/IMP cyclohydrolase [Vicingaceae bacterium]